jgi:transposase-like protein
MFWDTGRRRAEGANFWLSVVTDLQNRGVQDILVACVDGLTGFSEAIHAVFSKTEIQRCIIHQIRNSLRYISWKDHKAFVQDLKSIYQAPNREAGETNLHSLGEKWNNKYAIAVRSWENNWGELSTFFDYPAEIRRLIYTNNAIEGYNRQIRKVTKNKSSFPTAQSVRKLLYLANVDITKKWTRPIVSWALILNQLAIRFEERIPL